MQIPIDDFKVSLSRSGEPEAACRACYVLGSWDMSREVNDCWVHPLIAEIGSFFSF